MDKIKSLTSVVGCVAPCRFRIKIANLSGFGSSILDSWGTFRGPTLRHRASVSKKKKRLRVYFKFKRYGHWQHLIFSRFHNAGAQNFGTSQGSVPNILSWWCYHWQDIHNFWTAETNLYREPTSKFHRDSGSPTLQSIAKYLIYCNDLNSIRVSYGSLNWQNSLMHSRLQLRT